MALTMASSATATQRLARPPRQRRCMARLLKTAAGGLLCLLPALAHAHGARLEHHTVQGVALRAMYDTGEPMQAAQITVYAPSDPATPWLTGKADKEGRFSFVPDPSIAGMWAVQAREAGHGAMVQFAIGHASAAAATPASAAADGAAIATTPPVASSPAHALSGNSAHSPMQLWVMAASVVWGFVGTGLFFARKRTP